MRRGYGFLLSHTGSVSVGNGSVISVTGSRHHLAELSDPSLKSGCPLRLCAEPHNPHDAKPSQFATGARIRHPGTSRGAARSRLRNLLRGHDVRVMALSCRLSDVNGDGKDDLAVGTNAQDVGARPKL